MAPREVNAQLVWDGLVAVHPRGLTIGDLARRTGLTYSQAHYALGLVRSVFQEMHGQPIVCEPGTNRYMLPDDWSDDRIYLNYRTRVMLAQVLNLERNIAAAEMKWGPTRPIVRVKRDLKRLREDLRDMRV
jgi:hypothetical protein